MQQSVCVSLCVCGGTHCWWITGQLHNGQHKQTQSFQGTPRGTEFPRTSQHWASTIWQKNIQKYKEKKKIQIEGGGLQGRCKHKYETFEETLLNTLCVFNQFIFEVEAKQNSLQWFQSEALKGDNK